MKLPSKSVLLWIFAIIFTILVAEYQKMTGPTYPVKGKLMINNREINYSLYALPKIRKMQKSALISLIKPLLVALNINAIKAMIL
jgi:hypothetical protein